MIIIYCPLSLNVCIEYIHYVSFKEQFTKMAVNITVSMTVDAFSTIEEHCKEKGLSKSQFLTECALARIEGVQADG